MLTFKRFVIYALLSTLAAYGVVVSALESRRSLYSAIIFLTTNKTSMLVLGNMAAVAIIFAGFIVKSIFLGALKPAEVERVSETLRYSIPEMFIALTIFHEELSLRVCLLFASLLFARFFHVVAEERGGEAESSPLPLSSHLRLSSLLSSLLTADLLFLTASALALRAGKSVLILFAFEYAIMLLDAARVGYRYAVALWARRVGMQANDRSLCLLYGKLAADTLKLAIYCMYFAILYHYYGMPIIIIREMYRCYAEVTKEFNNVVAARKLRHQVHRMPAPTATDLSQYDPTCSICMDAVTIEGRAAAKILSCKHILHTECLLEWTQRQRICPMCRADINEMIDRPAAPPRAARAQQVPAQGQPQQAQPQQAQVQAQEPTAPHEAQIPPVNNDNTTSRSTPPAAASVAFAPQGQREEDTAQGTPDAAVQLPPFQPPTLQVVDPNNLQLLTALALQQRMQQMLLLQQLERQLEQQMQAAELTAPETSDDQPGSPGST